MITFLYQGTVCTPIGNGVTCVTSGATIGIGSTIGFVMAPSVARGIFFATTVLVTCLIIGIGSGNEIGIDAVEVGTTVVVG